MFRRIRPVLQLTFSVAAFATIMACNSARAATDTPALNDASTDIPLASIATQDTAYFAGGCFWGIQGVFQHVSGVIRATSGYSGGRIPTPSYQAVSSGSTGHAEAVRVIYDPSKVTLGSLLKVFFSVAHDPTQLNYQGPDHGTQYRSAVFYKSAEQKSVVEAYIAQLKKEKAFDDPIVTEVTAFKAWYDAEDYHQDYATIHPDEPYIATFDLPKIADLKKKFPAMWSEKKAGA